MTDKKRTWYIVVSGPTSEEVRLDFDDYPDARREFDENEDAKFLCRDDGTVLDCKGGIFI